MACGLSAHARDRFDLRTRKLPPPAKPDAGDDNCTFHLLDQFVTSPIPLFTLTNSRAYFRILGCFVFAASYSSSDRAKKNPLCWSAFLHAFQLWGIYIGVVSMLRPRWERWWSEESRALPSCVARACMNRKNRYVVPVNEYSFLGG